MPWRSSSRSKISPLPVTYVSIPSMSICFSCLTKCSTCSWLYGPKPPAPLPVEAAGPAKADPAAPAGPVPPLLPVEAAGPLKADPAAAGPVPLLPVEAAGGLLRPAAPRRKLLCVIELGPPKTAQSNRFHRALPGRTGTGESSKPAELTGESPRRCQRKSALIIADPPMHTLQRVNLRGSKVLAQKIADQG